MCENESFSLPCHYSHELTINTEMLHYTSLLLLLQQQQFNGSVKELNISIYFFFPPITLWCSISDVLFTGGRGVSDFSVLKYYSLNINYSVNILSECLRILIDCSQLSKTCNNVLFGCSTRENHS